MGEVEEVMVESIITDNMSECAICHRTPVEIHHIIFGTANRELSDKFGLVVPLCAYHHREGPTSVHAYAPANRYFKKIAQDKFKEVWKEYDFRTVFGKEWFDE